MTTIPAPLSIPVENQDKVVFKGLEVRLYPNEKQKVLIDKTLGCSRFLYNQMLAERKSFYEANKDNREALKKHKYKTEKQYKEEFEFLKEPDATALQQSRINLDMGFKNAFDSLSGKRKGPKMGFPVFKKKGGRETYRTVMGFKFLPKEQEVQIAKLGKVKFRHKGIQECYLDSELKSITVKRTASGKYFAVLLFKGKDDSKSRDSSKALKVIGLDMSLSSLYIDSDGNKPKNFEKQFRKGQKKLTRTQRSVSRKPMGSQNRVKASKKAACVQEDISNKRKDYSKKLAKNIVMENDVIGIEDLNLNGMKKLYGKSVSDISWSGFVLDLENNARKQGKLIHKVSRWYPSSKTCSCCGTIKTDLKIQDRSWTCICGVHHDRDFNAAKNIRQETIKNLIGSAGPESTSMEMDSNGRLIRNNKVILRTVNEVEIKPLKISLTN